jgi:glycerate 2-kinase
MKIIIAPDKFKDSLTSMEACEAMKAGVLHADENAIINLFPMADGGDGFTNVLKHYLHAQTIQCKTFNPLMREINAAYEWDTANKTAIIELATASGVALLKKEEKNPLKTSTYGTGLLIKNAISRGAKIILGLGGSATNDAGMGILAALGFQFINAADQILSPSGENLISIKKIIYPAVITSIHFTIACDVQNVLYGNDGAAFIYAKQKGADENAVKLLDEGLKNFAGIIKSQNGKDIANFPGAGAAGGVAAGLSAYFQLEIVSGAAMITAVSNIQTCIKDADMILTGEGRLDSQTLNGKVVQQIALSGHQFNVPVIALVGEAVITENEINQLKLKDVITITGSNINKEEAIANAASLLTKATRVLMENYKASS